MSCHESARKTALECVDRMEHEARGMAVLRSVDATEAAKWLREIASAIREACGGDATDDDEAIPAQLFHVIERPPCVPADCQRFIQLPSGLWAWVEGNVVCIENRKVADTVRYVFPSTSFAVFAHDGSISESDFLAARALGVRVLGWKS